MGHSAFCQGAISWIAGLMRHNPRSTASTETDDNLMSLKLIKPIEKNLSVGPFIGGRNEREIGP
jgi:hypothetical protein